VTKAQSHAAVPTLLRNAPIRLAIASNSARAFDEKVESTIVDSHDGANQIQHLHWDYGDQS